MAIIGVAVAIPEPWGGQLQAYRTSAGDPTASRIPTHITLVPPIEVDGSELPLVEKHLEAAAAEVTPFEVHLRGSDSFRPVSPVVFVALAGGGEDVSRLADACRSGPLRLDLPFPFHPHVTVAHDLPDAALDRAARDMAAFECVFLADHFLLYVHDVRQGWQPSRGFQLVPRAAR